MKTITNDEQNYRSGFAIFREILFPIIILSVMICFSKYVELTGNTLGHSICIIITMLAAFFCSYRLIHIFFYPEKVYSKVADVPAPNWFKTLTRPINYCINWLCEKKNSANDKISKNDAPLPAAAIEWDQYSDNLRIKLLQCWKYNATSKALRLAAPVVVLIKAEKLYVQPNYSQIIRFFKKQLNESIDNTQLTNECNLILDIIDNPSMYNDKFHKNKLMHYNKVMDILSTHLF